MSLAERVAWETCAGYLPYASVGYNVGYIVGGVRKCRKKCRIIYATEGVMLSYLASALNVEASSTNESGNSANKFLTFNDIGAIIVDEAHERNISTDLLIGLLKMVANQYPKLKIIVASATLDEKIFKSFFNNCRILTISGRTFPVDVNYEDLGDDDVSTRMVTKAMDVLNSTENGHILCFLMGQVEVEKAESDFNRLLQRQKMSPLTKGVKVYTLYGKQTPDQQQAVFEKSKENERKVIFSTDIAETSITIDGVEHIIDSGLAKVDDDDNLIFVRFFYCYILRFKGSGI